MLDASIKALVERSIETAAEVPRMEEESDRIYWFIVRQLLLAIRDRSTSSKIGIESPLHIVGNKVVAKTLEEMADSAENIANEVLALKDKEITRDTILTRSLSLQVRLRGSRWLRLLSCSSLLVA